MPPPTTVACLAVGDYAGNNGAILTMQPEHVQVEIRIDAMRVLFAIPTDHLLALIQTSHPKYLQ